MMVHLRSKGSDSTGAEYAPCHEGLKVCLNASTAAGVGARHCQNPGYLHTKQTCIFHKLFIGVWVLAILRGASSLHIFK